MPRRQLVLSETERQEWVDLRDHAREPYVRERSAARVARQGLLRLRDPDTVYAWLDRYQAMGCAGLKVHPGRGRKPAFSPSAHDGGSGSRPVAAPLPA